MKKVYLGDSVYASFDGYMIELTTENGGPPSNTILLEPDVYHALTKFVSGSHGAHGPHAPEPQGPTVADAVAAMDQYTRAKS